MSRHTITTDKVEAVLGWDPPLCTFFAQVWDLTVDEDDPTAELLWIGCNPGEIRGPQTVCDAVAEWVTVPADLVGKLYAEAHG
jgi:hypothetical protein